MSAEQTTHQAVRQDTRASSPSRVAAPGPAGARWAGLVPGIAAAAAIAAAATAAGGLLPVVGAPVIAIVAGIAVAGVRPVPPRMVPGVAFTSKAVLQGSIVVLGLNLSLSQVLATGRSSLPVLIGTLVLGLAVAAVAGRILGLRGDLQLLIGVGTAICGASAIAATDAVIDADDADVSYAIATIFTFNVVAVLAYPTLGHVLGLSQHAFGLWAGTAVNDMSSVVASTTVYGHGALQYGVVVKLTRTLAIIPICLALAAWRHRQTSGLSQSAGATAVWRIFPYFIIGFVVAVAINSVGAVPAAWHQGLADVATWMITAALAAIGLSTRPRAIRAAGAKPMVLGAVLWATVGLTSLALQSLTGGL